MEEHMEQKEPIQEQPIAQSNSLDKESSIGSLSKRTYLILGIAFFLLLLIPSLFYVNNIVSPKKTTPTPSPVKKVPPTPTMIINTPTATPSPLLSTTPKVIAPTIAVPTPVPTKSGIMGFTFDKIANGINIKKGTCVPFFKFTSTGSTQWHFQDFEPVYEVYWEKKNGAISNGETIEQKLCANADAKVESYPHMFYIRRYFYDDTSGRDQNLQVGWQVVD